MASGPVISLINLGCPKNTVDSEHILGGLVSRGFLIAAEPADAELCLINTCGFIESAKQESIDTILEVAELRNGPGPLRAVVAIGCMVERHRAELAAAIPEVDAWIGFADYDRLPELCERLTVPGQTPPALAPTRRHDPPRRGAPGVTGKAAGVHHDVSGPFLSAPRLRIGARHVAHLKISEGCDHPCTFCAIPKMRGGHRSRPIEWIVGEAARLAEHGARELVLIAQDTTNYGRDRYGAPCLPRLIDALLDVPGAPWLRVLYAHPAHLDTDVMDRIANVPRVCAYLDMPVQHIDDAVLRRMRRGTSGAHIRNLLAALKGRNPEVALRTTLLTGYPGETEAQFETLLDFIAEGWFAHLGCIAYSEEEGTPAALEADAVPESVRAERCERILAAQQRVAFARLDTLIGRTLETIVDAPMEGLGGEGPRSLHPADPGDHRDCDVATTARPSRKTGPGGTPAAGGWTGRTEWDAPEIDGLVRIDAGVHELAPGALARVEITGRSGYDLEARCTAVTRPADAHAPVAPASLPATAAEPFEV